MDDAEIREVLTSDFEKYIIPLFKHFEKKYGHVEAGANARFKKNKTEVSSLLQVPVLPESGLKGGLSAADVSIWEFSLDVTCALPGSRTFTPRTFFSYSKDVGRGFIGKEDTLTISENNVYIFSLVPVMLKCAENLGLELKLSSKPIGQTGRNNITLLGDFEFEEHGSKLQELARLTFAIDDFIDIYLNKPNPIKYD